MSENLGWLFDDANPNTPIDAEVERAEKEVAKQDAVDKMRAGLVKFFQSEHKAVLRDESEAFVSFTPNEDYVTFDGHLHLTDMAERMVAILNG